MSRTCHRSVDNDHPCIVCGAPFTTSRRLRDAWVIRVERGGVATTYVANGPTAPAAIQGLVVKLGREAPR